MDPVIVGSILVSLVHGLFPNHWLPVVVVSKIQSWKLKKVIGITLWLGLLHIISTLLLGFLIYYAGRSLFEDYEETLHHLPSIAFIAIGIIYFLLPEKNHRETNVQGKAWLGSLSAVMLLSPCLEVLPFFFAVSEKGWPGYLAISAVYTVFSMLGIILMAYLGFKMLTKVENNLLHKHEKKIVAFIFVGLGIISFFLE